MAKSLRSSKLPPLTASKERQTAPSGKQPHQLLPLERRTAVSLSLVYGVRMLGLFIILPVFAVFAAEYEGSTPFLVGLGLGIYGLTQAVLQIPFGMLSDRIGRKPVIIGGLCLFFAGSLIAALADSIYAVILGRALQGTGAISAALIALAADLTRDEQRTKVMATLGGSIGLAFVLALILGPVLVSFFNLSGLFWFTAFTAAAAILLVFFWVPTPARSKISGDTVANWQGLGTLLRDRQLLRLDLSIFVLHALVTATFVGIPAALAATDFPVAQHWKLYLPALLISVLVMVPLVILAEKYRHLRPVFLISIAGIGAAQLLFVIGHQSLWVAFVGVIVFFSFFNTLEALLPSLVSKLAPPGAKGSAMGIYSSGQFFGAFVGGVGGGWLYAEFQFGGLFAGLAALCALWMLAAWGLKSPKAVSSHLFPVGPLTQAQGIELATACMSVSGVEDAVVVPEEGVAYLKVDRRIFDPLTLELIPLPSNPGARS